MGKSRKGQASKERVNHWRSYPIYKSGLGTVGISWECKYRGCSLKLDFFKQLPEVPVEHPLRELWCGVYPEVLHWNEYVASTPIQWSAKDRYSSHCGSCPVDLPRRVKTQLLAHIDSLIKYRQLYGS